MILLGIDLLANGLKNRSFLTRFCEVFEQLRQQFAVLSGHGAHVSSSQGTRHELVVDVAVRSRDSDLGQPCLFVVPPRLIEDVDFVVSEGVLVFESNAETSPPMQSLRL